MLQEMDGEDQLDRSLKNDVLHKITKERSIVHTIKRSEANWICHILRRN